LKVEAHKKGEAARGNATFSLLLRRAWLPVLKNTHDSDKNLSIYRLFLLAGARSGK
jgi:hypothetical protein